jgi:hypothetical protein
MKLLLLALFGVASCTVVSCASDDNDYWSRIEELAKKGTSEANVEGRKYLMSLTKDQTLTALRQYGKVAEAKYSVDKWPQLIPNVALIMAFYAEPIQFSDKEFATLSDKTKRELQAGLIRGPLSEEAFDKLIAGIADRKEETFFRYALADYSVLKEGVGPSLSKAQKERLFDTYLSVVNDRQSPEVVRRECCDAAKEVLRREGWRIIYADDVVKELMRSGTPERRSKLDSLLTSGEIKLTPKTIEQLALWRRRIEDFRKKMVSLQDDEREPKSLRETAARYAAWLDNSPLMKVQGLDSSWPKE